MFAARQERIQVRFFRDVPEMPAESHQIILDVEAIEEDLACCRVLQTREHPSRRALAGSVWAKVSDNFPRPHDETDIVHGSSSVETLHEIAYFQHR